MTTTCRRQTLQTAPIVGLFGTIIGFLLGRTDGRSGTEAAGKPSPPALPAPPA